MWGFEIGVDGERLGKGVQGLCVLSLSLLVLLVLGADDVDVTFSADGLLINSAHCVSGRSDPGDGDGGET